MKTQVVRGPNPGSESETQESGSRMYRNEKGTKQKPQRFPSAWIHADSVARKISRTFLVK